MAGSSSENKGKETLSDVPDPIARTHSHQSSDEPVEEEQKIAKAQLGSNDNDKTENIETGRSRDDSEDDDNAERRAELQRMKSSATATSLASTTPTAQPNYTPKPWYKQPNPLRWGKIPPVPKERKVCPEHKAGFFSLIFFGWMGSLMTTGYKRQLEFKDIYSINPDRAVEPLTDKMRASFKRRVANGDKYPLLWAIHETFFFEFWLGGACQLSSSIMQVISPFTLRFLIQFATDAWVANSTGGPPPNIGHGIGLVLGVTALQVVQSLGTNQFIYRGMLVGGMARASLISLIYEKSMVISGRAKAGGSESNDIPALKAAEKHGKKGAPDAKPGVAGDGTGWGNGRIVSHYNPGYQISAFNTVLTCEFPGEPHERRHLQNRSSLWNVSHHLDSAHLLHHYSSTLDHQSDLQRACRVCLTRRRYADSHPRYQKPVREEKDNQQDH